MKKLLFILCFFNCLDIIAQNTAGIWYGGLIINLNGTPTTYRVPDGIGPGTNFSGANLGAIAAGNTVQITLARLASFKNGNCDVTDGRMYYRIYRQGTTAPSYSTVEFDFGCNCASNNFSCVSGGMACGGNDQIWHNESANVDLLSLAASNDGAAGTYNLDIYFEINVQGSPCNNTPTAISSTYTGTFTAAAPLPIELIKFDGKKQSTNAVLSWSTATEHQNSHFEVERSHDSQTWQPIGRVQGHGTTLEVQEYTFTDRQPLPGMNYYRLRQVDFDGKSEYSPIVSVEISAPKEMAAISPNPVSEDLFLTLPSESSETWQLTIYDLNGRVVRQAELINNTLNVSDLSQGLYFVRLSGQNGQLLLQERFLKK